MKVLVADGGGMRTAFTAGALIELHESGFGASYFDLLVGSSGGLCGQSYFATGQVEEGERIWANHMHGKFMKWEGFKPTNDRGHLEAVMREIEPLDCFALKKCKTKVVAALTGG